MTVRLMIGDCRSRLRELPDGSVHCCVSSPPYFGLRDYGVDGQIGLEDTPEAYVAKLVEVFREVRRVLRDDGTLWLNLGDSYAGGGNGGGGSFARDGVRGARLGVDKNKALRKGARAAVGDCKPKDLIGIPWMVAFALRADGWYLRSHIIWHKPNPMPESVTDRPTSAHESLFLLAKSERYFYDADAIREERTSDEDAATFRGGCYVGGALDNGIMGKRQVVGNKRVSARDNFRREGSKRAVATPGQTVGTHRPDRLDTVPNPDGRNKRNVWTVATRPFSDAHFATFPPDLIEPCIKAGCPTGGIVLDPFSGAGTTGLVADRLGREAILCELNPDYAAIAERRIKADAPMLTRLEVA